jgi:hypothetical protein
MHRFFIQSGILVLSFLSVFFWQKSDLAVYSVPLLGILTSLYLILNFKNRYRSKNQNSAPTYTGQILTVFLLNTSTLLLIQATGGINSFLFFLLYFLCFYIAFTFIPETIILFSAAIFFFFLPEASIGNSFLNLTKLISFLLLCPLAYFFGKEILSREKKEQAIQELKLDTRQKAENIVKDVEEIVKNEGTRLKEEDVEKLKDIVDQSREIEKETK